MSFLVLKQLSSGLKTSSSPIALKSFGLSLLETRNDLLACPHRSYKPLIKIKWKRPEPVPFNDPRKTGDLAPGLNTVLLDLQKPTLEFSQCESLKEADEFVKKVFSCDNRGKKNAFDILRKTVMDKVRRHSMDERSREVLIARYTVSIQSLQEHFKHHRCDKLGKVWLKELIDKRNKHLRLLRTEDYAKFEWLLEELQIQFRPGPTILNNVHRKESLRRLVDKHIDDVKVARLAELRNKFNKEKINFYKKKAETLTWIVEQEKKYGKQSSVSEEEIEELWKKYEKLSEKEVEEYEPPKHYHQFA